MFPLIAHIPFPPPPRILKRTPELGKFAPGLHTRIVCSAGSL